MKIIAVFNIKGGVGKTATTVNLAYAASLDKSKVLLADMDPQGASSFYYGIEREKLGKKIISGDKPISEIIQPTAFENIDLLPAQQDFRKMDAWLNELKQGKWLRNILSPVKKLYDYVILDCPPNITLYSENILRNADVILVPVVPTVLSVRTYKQLIQFCDQEKIDRTRLYPFFSMYESRKWLHNELIERFTRTYKETIDVVIPYNSRVERMGVYMQPFLHRYPDSEISYLYKQLWKFVKRRLEN